MTRDEAKHAIIEGVTGPQQAAILPRAELAGIESMFGPDTVAGDLAYVCGCRVTHWYGSAYEFRMDTSDGTALDRFEEQARALGLLRGDGDNARTS